MYISKNKSYFNHITQARIKIRIIITQKKDKISSMKS